MKIVLFQDYLRLGGTEKHTVHLANVFEESGHEVSVLSCRPGGELVGDLKAKHEVLQPFDTGINFWAPCLIGRLKKMQPDVVLLMGKVANGWGARIVSALPATMTVCTFRTGNVLNKRCLASYRKADLVVANSEWARRRGMDEGVSEDKMLCIPNAIHREWKRGELLSLREAKRKEMAVGDATVFIKVAGFRKGKGQAELIELLKDYESDLPWRLWLLGDGPERSACEALVSKFGLKDKVFFPGSVDDPLSYYASADIALFTSQAESLPNALIEAQWCGLPLITYDVGGVKECLDHGKSGYVVRLNDATVFRSKLDELHRSESQRSAMSNAAKVFVDSKYFEANTPSRYLEAFRLGQK